MRRSIPIALTLLSLVLLALALRLYRLGDAPLGLHNDEGYNVLDALRILEGWRPVFLPDNNGREPLFIYLQALAIHILGISVWSVRLVGALAGTAMVVAQFVFVRALPLPRPTVTALASAALIAGAFWPVAKGHQGLRAGLLPVWVALALWAWWRGTDAGRQTTDDGRPTTADGRPTRDNRQRAIDHHPPSVVGRPSAWAALAGVFVAAALYTHLNGRLLPLVFGGAALWTALRWRSWRPLATFGVTLSIAGVLALPLLLVFRDNPEWLSQRAGQVSVFSPEVNQGNLVGTLAGNAWKVALMPIVRGTDSWWENLAGRPVFDPLVAALFLGGLVWLSLDLLGRRGKAPQSAAVLVLLSFGIMLVPSWLSDGAPHYGRLTGIWPALFLLPAWALERSGAWLDRRRPRMGMVAMVGILAVSGLWSGYDFFGRYASAPEVQDAYRGQGVARGEAIRALAEAGPVYVSPSVWSQTPVRIATWGQRVSAFDIQHGLVLPEAGGASYVLEGWERDAARLARARWPVLRQETLRDERGETLLTVLRLPEAGRPLPEARDRPADTSIFGEHIRLLGRRVEGGRVKPGESVMLTLWWEALQPTTRDLSFFVHLVGPDGQLVGQTDAGPLGESYPTNIWSSGEIIVQPVRVPVKSEASSTSAQIRVGWYDWRTGERLSVAGDADAAVDVATIEVGR